MKLKFIIFLWCFIFSSAILAQNKIVGISTYFPQLDTIKIDKGDLDQLVKKSYVVCAKIDTLDDGGMVKTVEIECRDTTFKFLGAYMESAIFFPASKFILPKEGRFNSIKCEFAIVDNGELYQTFELDAFGRKYFEGLLNKTPLLCVDTYE